MQEDLQPEFCSAAINWTTTSWLASPCSNVYKDLQGFCYYVCIAWHRDAALESRLRLYFGNNITAAHLKMAEAPQGICCYPFVLTIHAALLLCHLTALTVLAPLQGSVPVPATFLKGCCSNTEKQHHLCSEASRSFKVLFSRRHCLVCLSNA